MTQHTCQSHANMNPTGMQMNPLPHHSTSNHIKTQNTNPTVLNVNPKIKHDYCQMFMTQSNDCDTSHEKYFHARRPNY